MEGWKDGKNECLCVLCVVVSQVCSLALHSFFLADGVVVLSLAVGRTHGIPSRLLSPVRILWLLGRTAECVSSTRVQAA